MGGGVASAQASNTDYYMRFEEGSPPRVDGSPVRVHYDDSDQDASGWQLWDYFWTRLFNSNNHDDSVDSAPQPGPRTEDTSDTSPHTAQATALLSRPNDKERKEEENTSVPVPMPPNSSNANCSLVGGQLLFCNSSNGTSSVVNRKPFLERVQSQVEPPRQRRNPHKTAIVVFLSICAVCSGCGLLITLATGTAAFRRRRFNLQAVELAARELLTRQTEGRRAAAQGQHREAKLPPRPVVIVGPRNDILVGFEVAPSLASKGSSASEEDVQIAVATQESPVPRNAAPPRLLLSPLSAAVRTSQDPRSPGQPVSPPRLSPDDPEARANLWQE